MLEEIRRTEPCRCRRIEAKTDYVNARRIINGTDVADRIAGYATKLEAMLRQSVVA